MINDKQPTIFVIFGITGNLAQKRLLPALYHLLKDNLLHEDTEIIGVSRQPMTTEDLLSKVELCVIEKDNVCDPMVLDLFRQKLKMIRLDPTKESDYDRLLTELQLIEEKHSLCMNRLYYLSIPPQVYEPVIHNFGKHHLNRGCSKHSGVARLLVEKPFGYDLTSAKDLILATNKYFSEEQIFRIDHYLAKETVQNILFFRKHNPIFSSLWDKNHIGSININLDEKIGIEGRGSFYDNVGALRDVVQNHLLQLLALVTMELPSNITGSLSLHRSKQALLADIKPIDVGEAKIIRAQYEGYRQEVENPNSSTETFISLDLKIDNDRWRGVPVHLETGKSLAYRRSAIQLTFGSKDQSQMANTLTFRIQPDEGIDLELIAKKPGFKSETEIVRMDFNYNDSFAEPAHPDAYERVLVDAIKGDHSLFATSQEVILAWQVLQPLLDAWENSSNNLKFYRPGALPSDI